MRRIGSFNTNSFAIFTVVKFASQPTHCGTKSHE